MLTGQGSFNELVWSAQAFRMVQQSLVISCLTEVLPFLLLACLAALFAFTGVHFRKFFTCAVCITSTMYLAYPTFALLGYGQLVDSLPGTSPRASIYLTCIMVILGVGLSILSSRVPEVPVYAMGVLGGGFGLMMLGYELTGVPFGTPLFWLIAAVAGALGAACVYFFEPYALIVGTATLGSTSLCFLLKYAFNCCLNFYQSGSMNPSLRGNTEVPVLAQLVLIAGAIGVQLWMGNHHCTCKQVRDLRAAKSLEGVPTSSPPVQLGYSKKDFF